MQSESKITGLIIRFNSKGILYDTTIYQIIECQLATWLLVNPLELPQERSKYTLKLTNLPAGTTAFNLQDYIQKLGGKTCKIPRIASSYQRQRVAYVEFETEDELEAALQDQAIFKDQYLT